MIGLMRCCDMILRLLVIVGYISGEEILYVYVVFFKI